MDSKNKLWRDKNSDFSDEIKTKSSNHAFHKQGIINNFLRKKTDVIKNSDALIKPQYNTVKILINTPDLSNKGGVASLYKTLMLFLNKKVDFFYTGTRGSDKTFFRNIYRIFADYFNFTIRVIRNQYSTIIINPSLADKALIRDAIFIFLSLLFNLKIVIFFHGWKSITEQRIEKRWKWLFSLFFFKVDVIIVLAEKYKNRLEAWGYKGKIIVGKTCVADDFLIRLHQPKNKQNKPYKSNFTLLFLSRIEKNKGIYEAIDIYKKLKIRKDKIKMIIAGNGNALSGVKRYVQENKLADIEFKGFVEGHEKVSVFAEADCYLFTSHSEGMPISVLEAMTAGLPLITTPVGGIVDFFEQKKMGYMIPLEKSDLMVDRLEELMQRKELSTRIGLYNQKYAQQHFSASRLSEMFQGLTQ